MAASRNLKLGIFVLAGLVALVVAAVVLGIHVMAQETVAFHSYFDESVQGLEIGAPVKYRGVRVGTVDKIDVAPDRKHVDVVLAISERDATRLQLERTELDLRAQLGGMGLTGLKLIDIDHADPKEPPPRLSFAPAHLYIPTRPSLMAGLATELEAMKRRVPELADRGTRTLDKLDRMLDDIHDTRLVARAGDALDHISGAAADAQRLVAHVEHARLPEHVTSTLKTTDQAIGQVTNVLRQVGGPTGLVASAHKAADTVGDLGRTTIASADELTRTVRDLGDAAKAIRELAEELERDPEVLIKGRERRAER